MRDQTRDSSDRAPRAPLLSLLISGIAALLIASTAHAVAREVVLNFVPPDDAVNGYRFYLKNGMTEAEDVRETGLVPKDVDGVARVVVVLDSGSPYDVSMSAFNEHGESDRSNSIQIAAEICDPVQCDDGNPCTIDTCESGGCFNDVRPDGTVCDDGFVDTVDDMCTGGACQGVVVQCRSDAECEDGYVCNGAEVCDAGMCVAGPPLDCGSPTQCAVGYCDYDIGCVLDAVPDGVACNDGDAATTGDACSAGLCVGMRPAPPPPAAEPSPADPPPANNVAPTEPAPPAMNDDETIVVAQITPPSVGPGVHTLTLRGIGLTGKLKIKFINGVGKGPKAGKVTVIDENTVQLAIKVKKGRATEPVAWDMLIKAKGLGTLVVPAAVTVVPE